MHTGRTRGRQRGSGRRRRRSRSSRSSQHGQRGSSAGGRGSCRPRPCGRGGTGCRGTGRRGRCRHRLRGRAFRTAGRRRRRSPWRWRSGRLPGRCRSAWRTAGGRWHGRCRACHRRRDCDAGSEVPLIATALRVAALAHPGEAIDRRGARHDEPRKPDADDLSLLWILVVTGSRRSTEAVEPRPDQVERRPRIAVRALEGRHLGVLRGRPLDEQEGAPRMEHQRERHCTDQDDSNKTHVVLSHDHGSMKRAFTSSVIE
jgi:hypothetical protein